MGIKSINIAFIFIGVSIGIILSLQIRANPVKNISSPIEQLELQKSLFSAFLDKQNELKKALNSAEAKLKETQDAIAKRTSKKNTLYLARLKERIGLNEIKGEGVRIVLSDNSSVARLNFSAINEYFVQAVDLRDLVNALFVKDAHAIAINSKRIIPLMPIQPVFDSILVDNFQTVSPFTVEAIGNSEALKEAVYEIAKKRKIQIFIENPAYIRLPAVDGLRSPKIMSLL